LAHEYSPAPIQSQDDIIETLNFTYEEACGCYCFLTVPNDYVAGSQILLKNGLFACAATAGKIKFKIVTYLIRPGTTVLGTYSNSNTSTNAEITVSGSANVSTLIGDIDLTTADGKINSVAVAGGDILMLLLTRDTSGESSSALDYARLVRDSFTPYFG